MTEEILPTTNKQFVRSIKKSMKVTKVLDQQIVKATKHLNKFVNPLSKTSELSKPFLVMKKQIESLNKAISANDLSDFQTTLTNIGVAFSDVITQSAQMIRSMNQASKSYNILSNAFQGELSIDDTSLISLDSQTKNLLQSFISFQTLLSSLKNKLALDGSNLKELVDIGRKITTEFFSMSQSINTFSTTFASSLPVVGNFSRALNDTIASIDASFSMLIATSEALNSALTNAIKEPEKQIKSTENSFQKLKTGLTDLFKPLENTSSMGNAFDEIKARISNLDENLGNIELPDFQSSVTGIGKAFQTVTSQSGSMFQNMNRSMDQTSQNYSLLKKVFKGKLEIDDSNFNRMDESTQNLVRRFSDAKNGLKVFKGELKIGDDAFKELDKASQISVKRFTELEKKISGVKETMSNTGFSMLAKIAPPKLTDPYASGELDPTAALRSTLDFGLEDIKQKLSKFSIVGTGLSKAIQGPMKIGTSALGGMVQGLVSVMGIAMKAIAPTAILGVALAGLALLDGQMGGQISSMIETATTKGPEIIKGFVDGIITKLPDLISSGAQIVAGLAEAISVNLPVIMQSAVDLIGALVNGVIESLPTLIPAALMLIESLATSLLAAAPQLLLTGLDLLIALVDGILTNKDQIITTVTNIIEAFTTNITNKLPEIIKKGVEVLTKLAEGIASVLPTLIPVALEAIATLVGTLLEQLPTLIDAAIKIVAALCKGLWDNLPDILLAASKLLWTFIEGIIGMLPDIATAGFKMANEIIKEITGVDLFEIGGNIIQGLIDGIEAGVKWLSKTLSNIGDSIQNFFTGKFKIHSPSRWMRDEIGAMLPAGLAIGIERNAHVINQPMDKLASQIMLPSLDSLDQHLETVQDISVQSSSKQTMIQTKQPATFNIKLGNQQFKAFVSDISEAMGQDSAINLAF